MVSVPRDELQTVAGHLEQQVGVRQAGSAAEATAAAYVNARLRRVGARVGTHAVTLPANPYRTTAAVFAFAAAAALLALWLPVPGGLLAAWTLGALLADRLFAPLPAFGARLASQNVFGTREIARDLGSAVQLPRWRVVLLARLDTPQQYHGVRRLLAPTRSGALARLLGPALALGVAPLALWAPVLAWLWAGVTIAYLALLIGLMLRPAPQTPPQPAVPAPAVLVAVLGSLSQLRHVEVWGVTLGGVAKGDGGATALLRSFPFATHDTLVIGIEDLSGAQLAYATREGALIGRPTAGNLLHLADAADAADTTIDAEPRPFRSDNGLTAPFRRRAYRTLTVFGAPDGAGAPERLGEQAVRFVTGIIEQLDRDTEADLTRR